VQYVAPGFFARVAYQARFPQSERSAINIVVWSVAASLPLVALGNQLARLTDVERSSTDWHYVVLLLLPAATLGYALAALRFNRRVRKLLGWFGLQHQPDGSLYALAMLSMSRAGVVTLELQDRRVVSGTPRGGPSYAEDDVDELLLTHPAWKIPEGGWSQEGAGAAVLIPLREVKFVTFSEDPMA
jgi:hypothetical protein